MPTTSSNLPGGFGGRKRLLQEGDLSGEGSEVDPCPFRNEFNPRIAVTVDMIATGTDVKPLECLIFMRDVKSRNYFEQMKGRVPDHRPGRPAQGDPSPNTRKTISSSSMPWASRNP
jgi:hypothetical protein